jgi:hypothetical protein
MNSFVTLQTDATDKLLSEPRLASINIFSQRKALIDGIADEATVWFAERNGRSGCGIMVEMPTIDVPAPNVPGPEYMLNLTCLVVEQPDNNMSPMTGTLKSAEEVAQMVLETFHAWLVPGIGALYAGDNAITPETGIDGVVAYRVRMSVRQQRTQTSKVATPGIAAEGTTITLSCATTGATIYYTTDESFPGSGNDAAIEYVAPFEAVDGQVIRAAGYLADYIGSDVLKATVTV